jgi:hypothetical protein
LDPTPFSELNEVLCELVARMRSVLEDKLVGVYLQGSFALGGFDVHSDVDFVAVCDDELSGDEVEELQVLHGDVYDLDCEWAQHLEGSYFPKSVLARPEGRGSQLWYLDNGSRSLVLSEHCNTVIVRWVLREHGVVLAGPPPQELVDPIPVGVLREEIERTMRDWGGEILAFPTRFENRFYQGFIVLSYAKMLHDLRAGRIGSKREGAEWAKDALDESWKDLIDRAWYTRPNPARSVRQLPDEVDFERTLEFVKYVIGEIARPN